MPTRRKRYQTEGHHHFITFSCYRRRPYLDEDHSRAVFEEALEKLRIRHQFLVSGYVLMPEHVHLLLAEPKPHPLATTMSVLKAETSKLLRGTRTRFWQVRCYDFNVFTHPKFVEKLRYIHRNPVQRGLVVKPEDYPWSSFRHWAIGEPGRVEIESHWTFTRRERNSISPPIPTPTHDQETVMNGAPKMISWLGHPPKWDEASGKVVAGLLRRRMAETAEFKSA